MNNLADAGSIETFTGLAFHLLEPAQDEICIEDIAHALSQQCRYTGHTRRFLSVAEHSYNVSLLVPESDQLWGLLHDASEAYIGDLSRPLKHSTPAGAPYLEIEDRIMREICRKFDLPFKMPPSVKRADNMMLLAEKRDLMTSLPWSKEASEVNAAGYEAARVRVLGLTPIDAEIMFLSRFSELRRARQLVEANSDFR